MSEPQQIVIKKPAPIVTALQSVLMLGLCAAGAKVAWDNYGPKPGPIDPDTNVTEIAESSLVSLNETIASTKRDVSKSRNWRTDLRRVLPDKVIDALVPIDDVIVESAESAPTKLEAVYQAISDGFDHGSDKLRRTLHDDDSQYVADCGAEFAKNFTVAARMAKNGSAELEICEFIAAKNRPVIQRLIDAVCGTSQLHGFGYLIESEPREELQQTSTALPLMKLAFNAPDEIDPRSWHQIENQGQMGSCQGHALSSVGEMADLIATGGRKTKQFSRLWCYYRSQQYDGILGKDIGSTLAGGLAVATQDGICREEKMPYPDPVVYTGRFANGSFEDAQNFKIRRHTWLKNYDEVFAFIASGQGGVEIGIRWPSDWMQCNGVLESFIPGQGGHAVCFLGYSKRTDRSGRKYLWMANSWGTEWGNGGWAEVSPSAVDAMFRNRDTVMLGLSDMSKKDIRRRDVSYFRSKA